MSPTDHQLNELLKTLGPVASLEAHPFAPFFWDEQGVLPTANAPWETLQPKVVQINNLPWVCWWLLHKQATGNKREKEQTNRLQKLYQQELHSLLEKGEPALYLRTSFLLNYFVVAHQVGGQKPESQDFLMQLPIETYIEQIVRETTVPLSFATGLTPISITLARLCRAVPSTSSVLVSIRDWLNDFTSLVRQYLLPVRMTEQLYSFFPTLINQADATCETTQHLMWAYGDLNQVFLFQAVAPVLNDATLLKLAERVGEFTTLRRAVDATMVEDTSVDQGTAGLSLMYDQLYRQTGSAAYLKARSYWLERTTAQPFSPTTTRPTDFLRGPIGTFLALRAIRESDDLLASVLFLN